MGSSLKNDPAVAGSAGPIPAPLYINVDCNSIILGKTTILNLSYGVFYSAV